VLYVSNDNRVRRQGRVYAIKVTTAAGFHANDYRKALFAASLQ
jgi:hypothetical protein